MVGGGGGWGGVQSHFHVQPNCSVEDVLCSRWVVTKSLSWFLLCDRMFHWNILIVCSSSSSFNDFTGTGLISFCCVSKILGMNFLSKG